MAIYQSRGFLAGLPASLSCSGVPLPKQVTVDTVLKPSKASPGLADATLTISFEEPEVPEGERLYPEHLDIAGSEFTLENTEAKRAKVIQVLKASKGTVQGSTGTRSFRGYLRNIRSGQAGQGQRDATSKKRS